MMEEAILHHLQVFRERCDLDGDMLEGSIGSNTAICMVR
jgi:hypothetical protein